MKTTIIITIIILVSLAAIASAGGLSSAKAVAMGGAQMGLAEGVYAAIYNPANLGLSSHQQTSLELAGAGIEFHNNSFSLDDYNKYNGSFLNDDDKSAILGKIPSEGLKVNADVEAGAMSFATGSFALSIVGHGAVATNLGKDALELFFNGVEINDTFTIDGMYSDANAYVSVGLSYGRPIINLGGKELSAGFTAKYIRGLAYEKITELRGGVITFATGYEGEGTMVAQTALGGTGYGLDIGAALKLTKDYTVGLAVENFISNINWNVETEEHYYHFEFDTLTIENMENDSIVITDEYSQPIPSFSDNLPSIMRAGIAKTTGKLKWAVDYVQGFTLAAGSTTKPLIAAGAEYRFIGFFPLRAGYSIGGGKSSIVSGGFGFDLGIFYLDMAVSSHSFMNFGAEKGLHVAVSTGLVF
ncbi:MAG: DUF5723 family protein [Candidatus Zixiibacteriota bacterium]